jgi:hypothetical protein
MRPLSAKARLREGAEILRAKGGGEIMMRKGELFV